MKDAQVKALTSFAHGSYSMAKGDSTTMPEAQAQDLVKHGFVEITGEGDPLDDDQAGRLTQDGVGPAIDNRTTLAVDPTRVASRAKTDALPGNIKDGRPETDATKMDPMQTRGSKTTDRTIASTGTAAPARTSANKAEGDSGTATRPASTEGAAAGSARAPAPSTASTSAPAPAPKK